MKKLDREQFKGLVLDYLKSDRKTSGLDFVENKMVYGLQRIQAIDFCDSEVLIVGVWGADTDSISINDTNSWIPNVEKLVDRWLDVAGSNVVYVFDNENDENHEIEMEKYFNIGEVDEDNFDQKMSEIFGL